MIKVKINDLASIWNVLNDILEVNDNPFSAHARRLLFKLQPEVKFLREATEEDIEALKDEQIELGNKIPAPAHYPDEYREILDLVCDDLPEKKSKLALIRESAKKKPEQKSD